MRRLLWAAVALAAAGFIALIWLNTRTLCDIDSAGHEVCNAGPVMGVPGGVIATFVLGLVAAFSLVRATRRE
ncbi:hypothetical protein [Demequina zhanjiangensis]|uniref:Vitamin K epoxide reductase family protein n=1 Tax=Demequina zhanjiangensis TaxID=3051659 RepID=A0ABT8G039_9MICO|nr:hypothetical protein [Demequina sp. SYSU T00b26]MDN4472084.1 hypothetical protein [Demequina sp. SYSU T00b26]